MKTMKNRFMIAILSTTLVLSGCACTNTKEKKEEKVVQKKKEKKKESIQEAINLPEEAEAKPVVDSGISSLYTDEELLAYANDHFHDYWQTYYGFMTGTYFESTREFGSSVITDPNIHSLQDIENVWYQKFSRRYPVPYMDMNINFYKEAPFWEENGRVYERNHIDGIVGHSIYFDHIVQKTDDEVWFALFSEGVDGTIQDWNQEWSFVYEDGQLKYGTVVRHNQ